MIIILETKEDKKEKRINLFRTKMRQGSDSYFSWEADKDGIGLKIFESETGAVDKVETGPSILTPHEEIISQFNDRKAEMIEAESAGIEPTDAAEAEEEPFPYDPELIRVDPKPYQVNLVHELINDGDIDLAPDFQRHFVWKNLGQRSRLIESMMLRIPLPVFYMAQDSEGRFQVVDGLQRLTVINQFLNNKFKLTKLEYLKDCENKYYKKDPDNSIEAKYARRITQAQLIFNVIDPQTPFRVKFDIFRRINQGGKALKAQEIRNCMASPKTRQLLKELSQSEQFKTATDNSINPIRMEDQELVLRFIGFYYHKYTKTAALKYAGYMNDFLDNTIDILNKHKGPQIEVRKAFYDSMENAAHLFGAYAFRKCKNEHLKPGAKKQFINKSLFTAWSVLLSQYNPQDVKKKLEPGSLNLPLANEIENNKKYYDALTVGTNDMRRMKDSFQFAEKIICEYL